MNEPLGYSREGEVVTLRMTADDWDLLMLEVGFIAGSADGLDASLMWKFVALFNRLNAGNPAYTAYKVPDDV